jgi:methylated-DNA-[protein]-cysteine S-methyltransferase
MTLIGMVSISEDGLGNIDGVYLPGQNLPARRDEETGAIAEAARQIDEYLLGRRRAFDLPLSLGGTEFQKSVWSEILKIPYGELATYSEVAERAGRPRAFRAAGTACGANPVPIIVPCHRVVGSSGSADRYGGGAALKRRLIELERGGA